MTKARGQGSTNSGGARTIEFHRSEQFPGVAVGYALPASDLRSYISNISHTRVAPEAGMIHDQIYPEWPNVRFSVEGEMTLCTGPGPLENCSPAGGIGPTSHATHFSLEPGRYWSIGLTPLGWARLFDASAADYAERWEPVGPDSVFAPFSPLLEVVARDDPDGVVAAICAHVRRLLDGPEPDEDKIRRAHAALVDPEVTTVGEFASKAGMTVRTLERLSATAFGFPPKLLLRRQRFLRSLSHFMLDPSLAWLETLDTQYVDQAHFIRDFKRFMDTTPRKYASQPHPVLWAAAHARAATTGTAMQVLQAPPQPAPRRPA